MAPKGDLHKAKGSIPKVLPFRFAAQACPGHRPGGITARQLRDPGAGLRSQSCPTLYACMYEANLELTVTVEQVVASNASCSYRWFSA